jgi:hypothetical protein
MHPFNLFPQNTAPSAPLRPIHTMRTGSALGHKLRDNSEEIAKNLNYLAMVTELAMAGMIIGSPLVDRYEKEHHRSLNPFRKRTHLSEAETKALEARQKATDGEEDDHWLNKAGYVAYGLGGPVKQVANGITAVLAGNPTSLFGMGSLIPLYPLVILNHGFWTKFAIIVTCQVATVGYGNIERHTQEQSVEKELARLEKRAPRDVPMRKCEELVEAVRWPALQRLAAGKLTAKDKHHWRKVGRFMIDDQKIAWQNSKQTVHDFGTLFHEGGKMAQNALHRTSKKIPVLKRVAHAFSGHAHMPETYKPRIPRVFTHSDSFFQLHQAGAMASYLIMIAQAVGRLTGQKKWSDPAAQVGLLATGPLLYYSMMQMAHQLWHKGGPGKRFVAASRAAAAIAMLIGDIFWFKAWGFGVYRAGSSIDALYRNETIETFNRKTP